MIAFGLYDSLRMAAIVDETLPQSGAALGIFPLLRGISEADCDRIFKALRTRRVRRGATLILNKELPDRVCFVWSGIFRIVLAPPPTRPVALKVARRGQVFGLFLNLSLNDWGEAVRLECRESGALLTMEIGQFAAFRQEMSTLADAVLAMSAENAIDNANRVFELATLSARERVQAEILRLAREGEWNGAHCSVRPAPTHQDLAEQVGAAREVVTRSLKAMAEEGLIRVERGELQILDVDRLLALDEAATGRRMYARRPAF